MRLRGHPVHVMLIHFPVALWPAHAALHIFDQHLPAGAAAVAGFWCLAVGTVTGWLAAVCGASDLFAWPPNPEPARWRAACWHLALNGTVLTGYTLLAALEWSRYPAIAPGRGLLGFELVLLATLGVGNFFGGEIVWGGSRATPTPDVTGNHGPSR